MAMPAPGVLEKVDSLLVELTEPTKINCCSAWVVNPTVLPLPVRVVAELPPANTITAPLEAA